MKTAACRVRNKVVLLDALCNNRHQPTTLLVVHIVIERV